MYVYRVFADDLEQAQKACLRKVLDEKVMKCEMVCIDFHNLVF